MRVCDTRMKMGEVRSERAGAQKCARNKWVCVQFLHRFCCGWQSSETFSREEIPRAAKRQPDTWLYKHRVPFVPLLCVRFGPRRCLQLAGWFMESSPSLSSMLFVELRFMRFTILDTNTRICLLGQSAAGSSVLVCPVVDRSVQRDVTCLNVKI